MGGSGLLLLIRTLGLTIPLWITAGWSAAEAAIFFLVADIPISWISVRSGYRAGVLAAIIASLASILGTLAVLYWAGQDPRGASSAMAALPGIDGALIAEAADRYRLGPQAVLAGAFSGIPFKLFALEAAQHGGLGLALLAPLLRLPRFLIAAVGAAWISRSLSRRLSLNGRMVLLLAFWIFFYACYFAVMPR
jgi:hypothetical protein